MKLDDIKKPIDAELIEFEKHFRDSMKTSVPLLDKITYYIAKSKGKQVRPMFVFFAAKLCGDINPASFVAASLVELLHTASLVHDDVVDDSYERRGFFSINALWKNKIAVLVGDYLLSQGLLVALRNNQVKLLTIMSDASCCKSKKHANWTLQKLFISILFVKKRRRSLRQRVQLARRRRHKTRR
jgi:octaprenyl-diphosphate synthase